MDNADCLSVDETCESSLHRNPAVNEVLQEALLPAEILWLVSVIPLASGSQGLMPLVGVLARRCTA